jgi:anti-sigma factor RsiW
MGSYMTITCEDLVTHLSDYLDGELGDELAQAARRHLANCENCRVVLDSTRKTILLYRKQGQVTQIPSGRKNGLYSRIAAAFAASDSSE